MSFYLIRADGDVGAGHGTAGKASSGAISFPWLIAMKCFLMSWMRLFWFAVFFGLPYCKARPSL